MRPYYRRLFRTSHGIPIAIFFIFLIAAQEVWCFCQERAIRRYQNEYKENSD